MKPLTFEAPVITIAETRVVRLPSNVSALLPSRGMVMVEGTIQDTPFQSPLEPDGKHGHWLNIDAISDTLPQFDSGDVVKFAITPTKNWPEPELADDISQAIKSSEEIHEIWNDITPMARWDWVRWINGTKNMETRTKRIEVMCSKLQNGKRRACCFNRTECTDTSVSKNGILLSA